jgi:hypothetical protein
MRQIEPSPRIHHTQSSYPKSESESVKLITYLYKRLEQYSGPSAEWYVAVYDAAYPNREACSALQVRQSWVI